MQAQQNRLPTPKSQRSNVLHIARIVLFTLTLLAVVITGIFFIVTGATSPSTISSGILTIILGLVAVIQIYPILFPAQSQPPPVANTTSTNNVQHLAAKAGQPIFQFNLPLHDPHEFFGRAAARNTLITRISNGGSSSIVGERRSGKTWLLTYLQLVVPIQSTLGPTYRFGYLSATHPQCKSQAGFVQRVLEEFKVQHHTSDLSQAPLSQLSHAIHDLRALGIHPVLCIDEFEGFDNKLEFNSDFFGGLRALAQDDGLILVTASKHPLGKLIEDLTGQTSPLFNIIQQVSLHPFTEEEAREFVELKSEQAGFDAEQQAYFLRWSTLYNAHGDPSWPPLRLQLVGQLLLDDQQADQQNSSGLQLDDPHYQQNFKQRLDEAYRAVVRPLV